MRRWRRLLRDKVNAAGLTRPTRPSPTTGLVAGWQRDCFRYSVLRTTWNLLMDLSAHVLQPHWGDRSRRTRCGHTKDVCLSQHSADRSAQVRGRGLQATSISLMGPTLTSQRPGADDGLVIGNLVTSWEMSWVTGGGLGLARTP